MSSREQLIRQLSKDLNVVKTSIPVDLMAIGWFVLSFVYVIAVSHWLGPIRPDALTQLVTEPRFFVESAAGLLAIAMVALSAFRAAVPGRLSNRFAGFSFFLLLLWISAYAVGLINPTLEPSMAGKREFCALQTALFALPPILLAFALTKRLYPLYPLHTTFSFSLAAGMMPALYMQIACMYIPAHILQHHILPGVIVGIVGAVLSLTYKKQK